MIIFQKCASLFIMLINQSINHVNMINIFASASQHNYMETPVQDASVSLTMCVSSHASDTKTRYNSWRLLLFHDNQVNNTSLQMKRAHT